MRLLTFVVALCLGVSAAADWTNEDVPVGLMPEGSALEDPAGTWTASGAGEDIWEDTDQFRYVYRELHGDFFFSARIDTLADTHAYAKAGLMLRSGLEPGAAHALINVFPHGLLEMGYREIPGASMKALPAGDGALPGLRLKLERRGDRITAFAAAGDEDFGDPRGQVQLPGLPEQVFVGFAVLSHDDAQLTSSSIRDWRIEEVSAIVQP